MENGKTGQVLNTIAKRLKRLDLSTDIKDESMSGFLEVTNSIYMIFKEIPENMIIEKINFEKFKKSNNKKYIAEIVDFFIKETTKSKNEIQIEPEIYDISENIFMGIHFDTVYVIYGTNENIIAIEFIDYLKKIRT